MKTMNVATTCRTCMKSQERDDGLVDLFQAFKLEDCTMELAEVLAECTATQVSKDDGLPQKLCEDCMNHLKIAYTFRIQAQNAQNEFKRIILVKAEVKNELEYKPENDFEYLAESFGFDIENFSELPKGDTKLSEQADYKCTKCNKTFKNEKRFLKHFLSHENVVQCNICSKCFSKQKSLDKHIIKHHPDFLSTESKQNLIEYKADETFEMKTENGEQIFKCTMCDMVFLKLRSLAMHKKKHKNTFKKRTKLFICDICSKEFSTKSVIKRHLKIHFNEKLYQCPKCPKKYTRRDQLADHVERHKEAKQNVCPYCSKTFHQTCSLKDHIRVHTRETPYLCSECGKSFANNSNLRQHMMRHSGLKPFACNLCPKAFSTKGQLSAHGTTHSGAHPFACETCGATFTKATSMRKHALIHLGLRPHACDECPMTFRCRDHLKRHYRVHTGEKPYKCQYCERAFTQSNDLVKHTRSHVGQNVYQCSVCSMRFRLVSELNQHYPSHYVGNPAEITRPKEENLPQFTKEPKPVQVQSLKSIKQELDTTYTFTFANQVLSNENGVLNITIGKI